MCVRAHASEFFLFVDLRVCACARVRARVETTLASVTFPPPSLTFFFCNTPGGNETSILGENAETALIHVLQQKVYDSAE